MIRSTPPVVVCLALLALAPASGASPAGAAASPRSWREVKCTRYGAAWSQALARLGTWGLGQEFLDRHAAFLASGCSAKADVCPRSEAEFKLANVMVILAMNAGTASTFPPFKCGG